MKALLILFLAISIGVNAYQYYECHPVDGPPATEPTCYTTSGFTDGRMIDKGESEQYLENFMAYTRDIDTVLQGGIITRSAIDSIMCKKDCNALVYYFGMDKDSRISADSSVFVSFTGAMVEFDPAGKPEIKDLGLSYYLPNLWCPPQCIP